jgi:HSP20 family protein
MAYLTRWDPFREIQQMSNLVDRVWENAQLSQSRTMDSVSWGLALDVIETDEAFLVKASVPGVQPENIEITFDDKTLTIRGELNAEKEEGDTRYHLRERRFGKFARSITLPTRINADQIVANYTAGVLVLTLPKAEEVKARRIEIASGESDKAGKKVIAGKFEKIKSKN